MQFSRSEKVSKNNRGIEKFFKDSLFHISNGEFEIDTKNMHHICQSIFAVHIVPNMPNRLLLRVYIEDDLCT